MLLVTQAPDGYADHRSWTHASLCSGYNALRLALGLLEVDKVFDDVFACDIDPNVRKVLMANFDDLMEGKNVFANIFDASVT